MKMRACREIEQKQQQQTSQKLGQSKAHFSETTEQHQRIYTELCSKIEIDVTATLAVVSGVKVCACECMLHFIQFMESRYLTFDSVSKKVSSEQRAPDSVPIIELEIDTPTSKLSKCAENNQ